jgi:alkylation response protein AidB-like acyl-CoA dehydrogenase
MSLQPLLDLTEVRDSARQVLFRAREQGTSADELWRTIASLGWLGISVPSDRGGLEQPFSALAVLYEELGRAMAPHSFVGSSVCLHALSGKVGSDGPASAILHQAISGDAILADATHAAVKTIGAQLHAVIADVPDADRATHLLLRVADGGSRIVGIALPHPAVTKARRDTWDQTRVLADLHIAGVDLVDTVPFVDGLAAEQAAINMRAHLDLAMACDAIGGADAVFDETLQYLLARRQFNRPIASFQAIKHRCADLATSLAGARALVGAAGRQFSNQEGDWSSAAAACRLYASAAYRDMSEEAIQLHGGMGFTWQHDCHRFLKRARCSDMLCGSPDRRKDELAPALFKSARH